MPSYFPSRIPTSPSFDLNGYESNNLSILSRILSAAFSLINLKPAVAFNTILVIYWYSLGMTSRALFSRGRIESIASSGFLENEDKPGFTII